MKFLRFLPIAAIACAAISCQNSSGGLSENSTVTDSLMNYLGEMHAADYLREAQRDTTLQESSEKQAYITGVRAGLASLKEGNDNYNKGVMMGVQMASQIMSFSEQMGIEINRAAYITSLTNALMADSMPNVAVAQTEFRRVMGNIEKAKEENDRVTSQESLKQVANAENLPKIDDDLYGKTTVPTDSAILNDGDEINLVAQISNVEGDAVNVPLPPKGKIGNKRNFPGVVTNAVLCLKSGETGEFLTTAHALLGGRVTQMGLKPTDVLKMKLTASLVPKVEDKKEDSK